MENPNTLEDLFEQEKMDGIFGNMTGDSGPAEDDPKPVDNPTETNGSPPGKVNKS